MGIIATTISFNLNYDKIAKSRDLKQKKESFVYDRTLRELLQGIPREFIKLLANKNAIELLETSFPKVEEKKADLLVRLEDNSLFHLEVQTKNDASMPKRMLKYASLIYEP